MALPNPVVVVPGITASEAQIATRLIAQALEQQGVGHGELTIHADRGPCMRSKPMAFLLADLGATKTHSRPYAWTDDPYAN